MRTWSSPQIPQLAVASPSPVLFNSATKRMEHPPLTNNQLSLYVCGITPYDATHLGHAFTYLTFDLLQRAYLAAKIPVVYAQNITDVDDPLLERAAATGVKWQQLAKEQTALFRADMHALNMLPPAHFIEVTGVINEIAAAVKKLADQGYTYELTSLETQQPDIYLDIDAVAKAGMWQLGDVAKLLPAEYLFLSAERGGDPERLGKRNRLDPLLWRAARPTEPRWETVVGTGRPGWHIECALIAADNLGTPFTVQGGGADLAFPHHELTAATIAGLCNSPLAHIYVHVALVSYQGHKMSKSRGNLVFVHKLLASGYTGSQIRLALMQHHYRSEWEWFDTDIAQAKTRLENWQSGLFAKTQTPQASSEVIAQLQAALANDLDTPLMLSIIDYAARSGVDDPLLLARAIWALLGIQLCAEVVND